MEQVGELIRKRYSFIVDDPRYAESIEKGRQEFQKEEKKGKKKRRGGFKKTFKEYLGISVQRKLFGKL